MNSPYNVVKDFEAALCNYTGARYAVAVNSCTMALQLAMAWQMQVRYGGRKSSDLQFMGYRPEVYIPRRTYVSVPMAACHAGFRPMFEDVDWLGNYQIKPLPVWDCARQFTFRMFFPGAFQCVSFHASKILGDTQGGAILHDNEEADAWLRRARFDGRTEGVAPKDDTFTQIGWHCYMSPDVAARLALKLYSLPRYNAPLPNDDYPQLDQMEIFK